MMPLGAGFALAVAMTVSARAQSSAADLRHRPDGGRLLIEMGQVRAVTVNRDFVYVGGRRFKLTPTVDAEQHLFVVADSARVVRRMVWIQVEARVPGDSGTYAYPNDSVRTIGGVRMNVSARSYTTPPEPTSDRGSAYRMVETAGYTMPSEANRLRVVHLPEQPARREVMIIYVEPGASRLPVLEELLARALAAVQLEAKE